MSYRVEYPDRRRCRGQSGRRSLAQAETAATGPQPPTTPQDATFCGSPAFPDPPPAQAVTAATGPRTPTTPQDATFCGSPAFPDPPPAQAVTAATGPRTPRTLSTRLHCSLLPFVFCLSVPTGVGNRASSASNALRSIGKAGLLNSHAIAVCGGAHRANDFCAPAGPQGRRAHTQPSPHPRDPARELSLSGPGESLDRGRRAPSGYPSLRPRMSRPDEGLGRGHRAPSRLHERARELSFTLTEMPFSGLPFSGFWSRR
jgi:hypothetical protein